MAPCRVRRGCSVGWRCRKQGHSFQVVVQWIVPVWAIEADLEIVPLPAVAFEDLSHLVTEVALHLKNEACGAAVLIAGSVCQDLLGEWVHAATGLTRAD